MWDPKASAQAILRRMKEFKNASPDERIRMLRGLGLSTIKAIILADQETAEDAAGEEPSDSTSTDPVLFRVLEKWDREWRAKQKQ